MRRDEIHFAIGDAECRIEQFCDGVVVNTRTLAGPGPRVWTSRWPEGQGTDVYIVRSDGTEVAHIAVPDLAHDWATVEAAGQEIQVLGAVLKPPGQA